tara:strand:- start:549 stop:854 length:306 start_codon:yes stop_codon:yes gene_type:complete
VDPEFANTPEMQALNESLIRSRKQKKMMAGSVFQFGREVPVYILQHLILSFGGAYVLQDQVSDLSEKDQEIVYKKVTHIVMDRPMVAGQQTLPENKSKEFV